jgi:cytochrome c oxidase subunit III
VPDTGDDAVSTAAPPLRAAAARRSMPNGWWGMVIFIAAEATLFGAIFGSYFYLRFNTHPWPPAGVPKPELVAPLVLTAILVATSPLMQIAYRAARRGRRARAWWVLLVAFLVQTGYLAYQLHLFVDDLQRFKPEGSAYASIYYVLLGADHAHVLVGLLLDLWLLGRLATRLTNYRLVGLQATTFYWHVVNGLTVLVVLTQLSPHV